MTGGSVLETRGLQKSFGGLTATQDVAIQLPPGARHVLIGPNGAGKTTPLLTIMGFVTLARGSIRFRGQDISTVPSHKRAQLGLGWVPQERNIFPSFSVEENLTVLARPDRWEIGAIYDLFPRLKERRANRGSQLSGGAQQMLTIARTLMTNPAVLLLDEPLEGLAPIIV